MHTTSWGVDKVSEARDVALWTPEASSWGVDTVSQARDVALWTPEASSWGADTVSQARDVALWTPEASSWGVDRVSEARDVAWPRGRTHQRRTPRDPSQPTVRSGSHLVGFVPANPPSAAPPDT